MADIGAQVQGKLTALIDEPANARDSQHRRDVWVAYRKFRTPWLEATLKAWRSALETPAKGLAKPAPDDFGAMSLVATDAVENKILASRLVAAVMDKVHAGFDDLRLRIKLLEAIEDLDAMDIVRPDVVILMLVEEWTRVGMPANSWPLASDVIQGSLIAHLNEAFRNANALLIQQGVMPTIELKDRVKAPVVRGGSKGASSPASPTPAEPQLSPSPPPNDQTAYNSGNAAPVHANQYRGVPSAAPSAEQEQGSAASGGGIFGGRLNWLRSSPNDAQPNLQSTPTALSSGAAPFWKQTSGQHTVQSAPQGGFDETQLLGNSTPIARARGKAQAVIGQIRRLFLTHVGGDLLGAAPMAPSAALAQAIGRPGSAPAYAMGGTLYEDYSPAGVARVAGALREQSTELKKKAETKSEKATIEIVALMFQAILSEERIPPGIRVWFARLQMPVLRVALEDPDFLGTTTHPARLLIDRMGSCVMGFDASGIQGKTMELEIKRIVQVIEQYPETGKKVYQVVFDEFQKFLAKYLTEKGGTKEVVSVAQQVEQKETMAIQYTIELRNTIKELPVRDEIRAFLFKVWAEVLAVAAVRKGPQHADTLILKKTATDLVWAASAKPNRADRAKVIQDLPNLLLRLRSGMTLLAMAPSEQEAYVKSVSDTLADAFLSKTQAIPQAQIEAMAQRLENLEDFVSDDGMGDLPLDAESIEMMLGIDASAIQVVNNGGSKPTAAMMAWANELQLGSWFTLDHNKQISQVQFAWSSARKHLNLFASPAGTCYLIQAGRLGAYLQAGLLLPQEDEALTVRATRDAMSKLEANPDILLS
ncbi:DUF1631 family protein [Rhodoferax aquaticus]